MDMQQLHRLSFYVKRIQKPHIEIFGDVDMSEELRDFVPGSIELKGAAAKRRTEVGGGYEGA